MMCSGIEQVGDVWYYSSLMSDHRLLHLLEKSPNLSQRELAEELGISLGKTHYLLKALIDKGLIKVNNFRRHDNKIAYLYQLTPTGLAAKIEITQAFLRRKETEYEALKAEILALRTELQSQVPQQLALDLGDESHV